MYKTFIFLIGALVSEVGLAQTNEINYELARSEQTPGFLVLALYPDTEMTTIEVQSTTDNLNLIQVTQKINPENGDNFFLVTARFEEPKKSAMQLNATIKEQELETEIELPLNLYLKNQALESTLYRLYPNANNLADIWEMNQAVSASSDSYEKPTRSKPWWLNLFPIILLSFGLILILSAIIWGRKKSTKKPVKKNHPASPLESAISSKEPETHKDLDPGHFDQDFWQTPIDEMPLYKAWEKHLPFTVEENNDTKKNR